MSIHAVLFPDRHRYFNFCATSPKRFSKRRRYMARRLTRRRTSTALFSTRSTPCCRRLCPPLGGRSWLFSSLLRGFEGDDDDDGGEDEADQDVDKDNKSDEQVTETNIGISDLCGFCQSWFDTAVGKVENVAGNTMEVITEEVENRMDEKIAEAVNTSEDYLRVGWQDWEISSRITPTTKS